MIDASPEDDLGRTSSIPKKHVEWKTAPIAELDPQGRGGVHRVLMGGQHQAVRGVRRKSCPTKKVVFTFGLGAKQATPITPGLDHGRDQPATTGRATKDARSARAPRGCPRERDQPSTPTGWDPTTLGRLAVARDGAGDPGPDVPLMDRAKEVDPMTTSSWFPPP